MKKSIRSLAALAVMAAAALSASAQPAVKIATVNLAKLFDGHYETQAQNAKLQADKARAEEEVERFNKEGNALVEQYKNLQEQSTNAMLTPEAKSKAQDDAARKLEEIQAKQNERNSFIQSTAQSMQQRYQTFRSLLLEQISKVAVDVAKRKGATLLVDSFGPSMLGISNVVYADPGFDITDEVQKEIDKSRPAGTPAAPAPAATAPAQQAPTQAQPAQGAAGPTINLPIAPKK